MLVEIFGNKTAAMVMLYLYHYGEAYPTGLAKDMGITLSQVQKQMDKFDQAGLLVSKKSGTVRIYQFNPKSPVARKVKELVKIFYDGMGIEEREKLFQVRRRPRRKGKPVIGRSQ
ncbi:MAG: winged helix-turn-helix domain-containing protein [Bdellovibrionales bacterium]